LTAWDVSVWGRPCAWRQRDASSAQKEWLRYLARGPWIRWIASPIC
jgi:hypothetical protein